MGLFSGAREAMEINKQRMREINKQRMRRYYYPPSDHNPRHRSHAPDHRPPIVPTIGTLNTPPPAPDPPPCHPRGQPASRNSPQQRYDDDLNPPTSAPEGVSKPKKDRNDVHLRPTGTRIPDRSRRVFIDSNGGHWRGTSASDRDLPHRGLEGHPPERESEHRRPPVRDPRHSAQPPAMPPSPENPEYKDPPQRFDAKRVIPRHPEELCEEASGDISSDTGTEYPCTQADLDACGGNSRRASKTRDHAELRAMWFSQPNQRPLVGIKAAAMEIYEYNSPKRVPSAQEHAAIERLITMLDNACHDFWGPDIAIKVFCDLDTVFFRGKLKGNVCIAWGRPEDFPRTTAFGSVYGHTGNIGHGKALIQLNARGIFLDRRFRNGKLFTQMLATVLHEMIHAYQIVKCPKHGRDGFAAAHARQNNGHGKCFGTMMRAVNARAFGLLGLEGDSTRYPYYNYHKGEGLP